MEREYSFFLEYSSLELTYSFNYAIIFTIRWHRLLSTINCSTASTFRYYQKLLDSINNN